ncbi:tRNA (guanine-N(1)-)-methyltransferase [Spiroplasma clarkii]|uniref:tRNA (guanine-N(1)-)-methyltransferase n=1 Tax=Spiroplasma clarkii TaxID=2139 RepID=A0A1Y0L2R5_9MOLU|nr:tRNA (guanosine(37)-N1)-methyltransferase TrmD [Spiroplasma clarkii]ARU92060.1 tRNA (guanine-N(1)-)-methyltransferase [Spiroplasma clarkii]ATX71389.1 tRNA (guanine-N(1)-)-methyltransferase [Spiroplasma clarkii]
MKFSIITLFPNLISSYISESIIKRAIDKQKIEIDIIDLRQHTTYSHNQVDDYQFGGGKGMVLMVEPVVNAINSCKTKDSVVLLTSPQGKTWSQNLVKTFKNNYQHLIIVCGHYEGFDERILDYIDFEVSVGDYVITGGELASLIVVDSITRLIEGVIANESHQNDSFENNLLDHPVYTKPVEFDGKKVPEVLLSGHHANIEKFRQQGRIKNTYDKRPDLLETNNWSADDLDYLKKLQKKLKGD